MVTFYCSKKIFLFHFEQKTNFSHMEKYAKKYDHCNFKMSKESDKILK